MVARLATLFLSLLIGLGLVPAASGQDAGLPAPGEAVDGVVRERAVQVSARQFGVGGIVRPGDWSGVELTLKQTSSGGPLRAAVQIHRRDPDGDTLLVRREVSLVPGAERSVWLYVPQDWDVRNSQQFTVSVRALPDEATGEEVTVGSQVEATALLPGEVARATESLIGVIGIETFGLEQYELLTVLRSQPERVRTAHGEWRLVSGLAPADLPDRWMGLAPFEVLVWGEGDLRALAGGRADALREWVRRGGHLVVVPDIINPAWFSPDNPLADVLPMGEFERREDIDLGQFRNLFVRPQNDREFPARTVGYIFTPDDEAQRSEAGVVIEGREGPVVATRNLGAGLVTVIGLDLRNRALGGGSDLRADQFWHRLFSQRFLIPAATEVGNQDIRRRLQGLATRGQEVFVDTFVANAINRSTAVGVGLLLAIVVFAVYWIVAGPGGFALLKGRGKSHLAWVVFVASAAVFSLIGWVGARALSPVRVSGEHITFIDGVYGESVQRTRTWVSVLLPDYGERTVSVGEADDANSNAIMPWNSPDQTTAVTFPDARSYVMSASDPWRLAVPTRSTVKQFRADWLGPAVWEMPFPPTPADRPSATAQGLRGSLVHNLPGALTNVTVVLNLGPVSEQAMLDSYTKDEGRGQDRRTRTYAWRKNPALTDGADWAPGQPMDLGVYRIVGDELLQQRLRNQLPASSTFSAVPTVDTAAGLSLANWLGHIPGPDLAGLAQASPTVALQRTTHGLDLTKHLMRPCLIITGEVVDACPTPLRVGGDEFEMSGRTVVRWVFPLEDDPLRLEGLVVDADSRGTGGGN